jgi:hypothetical protein
MSHSIKKLLIEAPVVYRNSANVKSTPPPGTPAQEQAITKTTDLFLAQVGRPGDEIPTDIRAQMQRLLRVFLRDLAGEK